MSIINPIKYYDGNSYTNLDAKNIAFTSSLTGITLDNTGGGPSLQDALIQINDNKISKTGDTMTSSLNIEMSGNAAKLRTIDSAITLGTNPSEQITSGGVAMIDGNGVTYANMYTYQETNGRTNLVFSLSNKSSSTANLNSSNNLMLRQMPDGTNSVWVTAPAAWRSALGVDTLSSTSFTSNGGTIYLRKATNGLVTIDGSMNTIAAAQTDSTSAIPSGYRPARTLYLFGWDSGNNMRRVRIGTDGKITPYSGTASGIWFCATYSTT